MKRSRSLPRETRYLPFLPMLYVAWSDGDLSEDEILAVRENIRRGLQTQTSPLEDWLDPTRPPSAVELQLLLSHIREGAKNLDAAAIHSLAGLAARLKPELSEEERAALGEIEAILAVCGAEAARKILLPKRPPLPKKPLLPSFDIAAMTALLERDHPRVRERMRRFLSRIPHVCELSKETYREWVLARCRELAQQGFGNLSYPTHVGGQNDAGGFIAAFETLAFHDLSLLVKFGVQFGLFGGSILQLGTEDHHARYLADVGRLHLAGCFAMTESGHGSNVRELETTATYDTRADEFVIHTPSPESRKDYIGNAAAHGRMATVFAQLHLGNFCHGVHAFLVPIRDETGRALTGISIEDCGGKMGLNGVDNGRLCFDRVRVPRTALLNRFGDVSPEGEYSSPIADPDRRFFTMLGTLVGGRIAVACAADSVAKSALTIAVRYGFRRCQFGPDGGGETRLMDYPSHQRRLLPELATTYALDFSLKKLARLYASAEPHDRRHLETLAAGLKAFASQHATATVQACREACGGAGYLAVNRFAALKADSEVFTTFEGDNRVLLQLVAKGLLSGYRRQFSDMSFIKMIGFLASLTGSAIGERSPIAFRSSIEGRALCSRQYQLKAFRWRAEHILGSLARRLKQRLDQGMDSFNALLECQNHALVSAAAWVELQLFECFDDSIETHDQRDPSPEGSDREGSGREGSDREGSGRSGLKPVLVLVRNLFALTLLERNRAWFLEHGYFDGGTSKNLQKQVTRLCRQIKPHALSLVEAFAIPESCLGAPIGRGLFEKSGGP